MSSINENNTEVENCTSVSTENQNLTESDVSDQGIESIGDSPGTLY